MKSLNAIVAALILISLTACRVEGHFQQAAVFITSQAAPALIRITTDPTGPEVCPVTSHFSEHSNGTVQLCDEAKKKRSA